MLLIPFKSFILIYAAINGAGESPIGEMYEQSSVPKIV